MLSIVDCSVPLLYKHNNNSLATIITSSAQPVDAMPITLSSLKG